MAMLLCHSPKGGAGTTFLAAQLALALADLGKDVTVAALADFDTVPFHFGLPASHVLPPLSAPTDHAIVVQGIDLRNCANAARGRNLVAALAGAGLLTPSAERVVIVDASSADTSFTEDLLPHVDVSICSLAATPDCISLLPRVFEQTSYDRSLFVLGNLDETRRLSRDTAGFAAELLGARLIGRVRHDESVREALAMLQPLAKYAPASVALADVRALAQKIAPKLGADRTAADRDMDILPNASRVA
jgi:cellulose biosynthesis protein BcsQ